MKYHSHIAVIAMLGMSFCGLTPAAHAGAFIESGSVTGGFGFFEPWEFFNFKFGIGDSDAGFPDEPNSPTWLFEIDAVNESFEGFTWIVDESTPNFATFETDVTNGIVDLFYLYYETEEIALHPRGMFGHAEFGVLFGPFNEGEPPDPSDPVDLQGYDLTDIHFTFDILNYGLEEVAPGVIVYGYEFEYRVDFYGNATPAPSATAVLAVAALRRRRRRH